MEAKENLTCRNSALRRWVLVQFETSASLECGALAPLWPKRRQVGALQRRTWASADIRILDEAGQPLFMQSPDSKALPVEILRTLQSADGIADIRSGV